MPTPSLLLVPARFKTGRLYSQIPTANGDFTVTRNTTATRLNDAGVIESVASGIPRLDYSVSGFVTGCPALLVEPAATNEIRNNSNTNAVTGTPGTLPTNWTETLAGLTRSVIALGAENGVQYIDVRLSGTANATEALINFESPTQTVASNGQVWTNSCFLKSISAPVPYTGLRLSTVERTSGGIFVASGNSPDLTLTSTLNRFSFTRTLSGGGTVARVQSRISFGLVSGTAYNFTVRIGYPQMELGSVATSVIPTTAGTGSRSADVISVSGAVSGSIGQTAGTIYCEFAFFGTPTARSGPIFLRQAASRGMSINFSTSDSPTGISFISRNDAGSTALTIVSGALQLGTFYKVAIGYDAAGTAAGGSQASGVVAYVNGVQTAIGTLRVPDAAGLTEFRMYAASAGSDTEAFNGRIRAAALYTTRLTNAELAALTAP
jgi:hypothetical protein